MTKAQSLLRYLSVALVSLIVSTSAYATHDFTGVKALANRMSDNKLDGKITFEEIAEGTEGEHAVIVPVDANGFKIQATSVHAASLALGVYLRDIAGGHISWCGKRMPETWAMPTGERRVVKARYPYAMAYNYCTLSYTMAYWSEQAWQDEIDRLALSGYSQALVMAGVQDIWRRTMNDLGYTKQQQQDFITDDAVQAWWLMGNLQAIGNKTANGHYPIVSEEEITEDARIGKSIVRMMRAVGIEPILQGFIGLVPSTTTKSQIVTYLNNHPQVCTDYGITDTSAAVNIFVNGNYVVGQKNPDLLDPTCKAFHLFSDTWNKNLKKVYGMDEDTPEADRTWNPKFLGGDLFHESSPPGSMTYEQKVNCAVNVQAYQQAAFPGVTWVLQSWQGSPDQTLRNGLDPEHTVIQFLDQTMSATDARNSSYYNQTTGKYLPWVWVEVMNFGGNTGMHGAFRRFRNVGNLGSGNEYFKGYGLLSEGLETNPISYDMYNSRFTETTQDAQNISDTELEPWMAAYRQRRYGLTTDNEYLKAANTICARTVWDCSRNQQGTIESVFCAFPSYSVSKVSAWGPTTGLPYDRFKLIEAARLFLEAAKADSSLLKLETFKYDFVEIFQQILADKAREMLPECATSKKRRDEFRLMLVLVDKILACSDEWRLDKKEARVIGKAATTGPAAYRRMITTWTPGKLGQTQLSQYAHRSYAGLVEHYYAEKWNAFFDVADGVRTKAEFDAICSDLDVNFPTKELPTTAYPADPIAVAEEIMDFLTPKALTWNGNENDTLQGNNWTNGKGEQVAFTDENNIVLKGVDKTITSTSAAVVGNISLITDTSHASNTWGGTGNGTYIVTNQSLGWKVNSLDELAASSYYGIMSGGWMAGAKLECQGYHVKRVSDGVELQLQVIHNSNGVYVKVVGIKLTIDADGNVYATHLWAKNGNPDTLGSEYNANSSSANSNPNAVDNGTPRYGLIGLSRCPASSVTLAGPVTVMGEVILNKGESLSIPEATNLETISLDSGNATLVLGTNQNLSIGMISASNGAKLILKGTEEVLGGAVGAAKVKLPKSLLTNVVYVGPSGEEQSLKLDAAGYLKTRIGTLNYSSFVSSQYAKTGWKNISLDDLAECEITGTMSGGWINASARGSATRCYQIEKTDDTVTAYMQIYEGGTTKSLKLTFTLVNDGYIYVMGSDGGYKSGDHCGEVIAKTNNHVPTSATADGYGVASITIKPAVVRVEATKSNYSDFASAVSAATAKTDKSMTLIDDTNFSGTRIQTAFTLTIPEGLTLKADNGQNDPFHWNYANVFDVYGTLDFGAHYQSAAGTKGFGINLYGGELTASGANALSVYEATTFNVHADGEKTTSKISSGMQVRAAITLNVDAGATLEMTGDFNASSDSKSGTPGVYKTGEGIFVFNGKNVSGYPTVLEAGTLKKTLIPEEVFVVTINGGTAALSVLDDEQYKITETIEGAVHTFTCVKKDNKFRVTNPGEISDNMPGKNFETLEEALEYAMKLYTQVEGMQVVKIWMLTDKLDAAKKIMEAYNTANGTHFNHFGDGNGNELQGWQPAADEKNPFDAVKAIIGRLAGGYNGASEEGLDTEKANEAMAKFVFQLMDGEGDVATVGPNPDQDGTILIKATTVSAASFGLGQYLRHTAKMHISWCGNRVTNDFPIPTETTTYTPAIPVRFAYNYCTLSYTMAFWSEKEWREEIDRLALSGYNVALVLQGLQEAWRKTLESVKNSSNNCVYSKLQIMKYVSDEAAQAWWHMGNLEGLGGPLGSDKGAYGKTEDEINAAYERFKARTAADAVLGEYIYAEMMKLGIQPSIQSFVGLVPDCSNDVLKFGVDENGARFDSLDNWGIINEGGWQGYTRPDVVNPLNKAFDIMSAAWYGALVEIYKPAENGYTSYMGGDLFHEGGNKGSLTDANLADIAKKIQDTQAAYFGNGGKNKVTWVLQSWQGSPYQGIRNGLDCSKAIIQLLDKDMSTTGGVGANYYAYKSTGTEHIPWIWVEVLNFGGNTGMHGGARRFRNLSKIGTASGHSASFKGYGILSEGLETNPMMYDMFNDAFTREVGQDSSIDDTKIQQWISDYCERRYSLVDDNLKKAYGILINTVFDCSRYQEGCVENMLCAGPSASVANVSKWGPTGGIEYDPAELYPAAYSFLDAAKAHPELLELETFQYDFVELFLQIIGERGRVINAEITTPGAKRTLFLKLFDLAERLTASSNRWRLDWHEARTLTVCPKDEKGVSAGIRGYRRMVTCWADGYAAGQATGLREYAFRAYSGLLKDYYLKRWLAWFDQLDGKITQAQYTAFLSNLDETFMTAELTPTPAGDLIKIGEEILETLNPPALTINATGDTVNWTNDTWTDAKGQSTTWTDDYDVNMSGVCTVSAEKAVNVGSFTMTPSVVADVATYTGYLPVGADNAVKLFSNLREEDRANVAYFRGIMNGGWVAQGEARSYQVNDGSEYCEMQMQRVDDGYLKSVRVRTYFNPNDNGIWGYAVNAGNIHGGVLGANVTGTGTSVATSDTANGYGIKNFEAVMNSVITLNGDIKISGTLTVSGGKLTLTTSNQAKTPGEIIIENGTLILGADVNNVTLNNIKIGVGGKLIVMGTGDFNKTIKLTGSTPAAGTIVYNNGTEEIPLTVLSDGTLKIALAAKTYDGEIGNVQWIDLGWKNLTIDDLAICEFISGGARASNITKDNGTVTMLIGRSSIKLGIVNGIVKAMVMEGDAITGLQLNPAEAQIVSSKTNYATFAEAVAAAAGAEIKILVDTEIKASTTAAMTITIPSGITLKADGKLPWDQSSLTLNVYGTIDFGLSYKEFGNESNKGHVHALNLYAGSRVKGGNTVSFYTDFTINVLDDEMVATKDKVVIFSPTFRSCKNTTVNVAQGVTFVVDSDIIPRASVANVGYADPYVIKTGAGTLKLGGVLKDGVDATPHIELRDGTLARALEAEEIFSAKVTGGTTDMTSADEDYEVIEPADPIDNVHTWKSQGIVWLFFVTKPGETGQNGEVSKKFRHLTDAVNWALDLRAKNPGKTVKLWAVVANDSLAKEEISKEGYDDPVLSPNGLEVIGWDEPIRYYYTSGDAGGKAWGTSDTVTGYQGDKVKEENHAITAGDIIMFDKSKGTGYTDGTLGLLRINPDIVCTEIDIVNGTTVQLAIYTDASISSGASIPSGWTVNVGENSYLKFNDQKTEATVKVPKAQFNGKGMISFGVNVTYDSNIEFGEIKGTATIEIPNNLVMKQENSNSFIENPLAGRGTLQVKNVKAAYTLAEGSEVKFTVDPSVVGSWKAVKNGNVVTFEEAITRLWTGDAVATQKDEYTDLLVGISLAELTNNGGVYELGANFNGRRSYPPVEYSDETETSAIATFNNGSETATLELIQDGVKIKGRQTNGETITRVAAAIHYPVRGIVAWNARPAELIDEDIIVVERFAELTLGYSFANHFVGEGTVITTVEPSTDLKESAQFRNWKGTLVLSALDVAGINPSDFGNANSVVELKNCTGSFAGNGGSSDVPLKITGTLAITDGVSGGTFTLAKLAGDGAITLNRSLDSDQNIKVIDSSEWKGTIEEAANNSVKILFATIKIGDNFYFTNQEAKDASKANETIEFLKTKDGQILSAKDPTQTLRVHSGFNGNYTLDSTVEGLYYKSADLVGDGRSDLKFFDANDSAFRKTWTNIFLGPTMQAAAGNWMTSTEWSRKNGNLLVRLSNGMVPHVSGTDAYTSCLIDGTNLRRVPVGNDGYKHVEAGTIDGWNTAIGVMNGVAVTIDGYKKMQGDNNDTNYIYVDKTSKLTLNGSPTKFEKYFNLHSAAVEGITIGFNRDDAKYNHYLEGDGTVHFSAQNINGTHVIKSAAISLGVNDHDQMTETIKSKKLVSYQSKGDITASIATGAVTKIDGNEELTEVTGRNLTLEGETRDSVGSYTLRVADDGIYLDYVAWGSRRYLRWDNTKTYWDASNGTTSGSHVSKCKAFLTSGNADSNGEIISQDLVDITTDDVVQFDSGFGDKTLYINHNLRGMCIKVLSGTTLRIGKADQISTIPSDFIIIIENGAEVILTSWNKEAAVIGDNVRFIDDVSNVGQGARGKVTLDTNKVTSLSIGSLANNNIPIATDKIPVKITNASSEASIVVNDMKDDSAVKISLSAQWVSENFLDKAIDLKSEGENGMKVWESYVLGLSPTDEASTPIVAAEQTSDPNTFKLDIPNVKIVDSEKSGVTVTPKLLVGDSVDGFTEDKSASYDKGFTISVPTGDTKVKYYKIKYEIKHEIK